MSSERITVGVLVSANLLTLAILMLAYFCYLHLQHYIYCLIYGCLFAEALWPIKMKIKKFLQKRSVYFGDFVLSLSLLGILGCTLLSFVVMLCIFAFVDLLDIGRAIQLAVTQTDTQIPKEWVQISHQWLTNQVSELEHYNTTAWYPLVNETLTYIGNLSDQDSAPSQWTFYESLWDADIQNTIITRVQLLISELTNWSDLQEYALSSAMTSASIFSTVVWEAFTFVGNTMDGLSRAIFVVALAQYLLSRENNMLRSFINDFTKCKKESSLLEDEIHAMLDSAFVYPIMVSFTQGTMTLLLCLIFGVPYHFLATLVLIFLTIVPLIGSFPTVALVAFVLPTGHFYRGIVFLITHYGCFTVLNDWDLRKTHGSTTADPYLTALIVLLGYSSMGVQAIIIGPLCFGPLKLAYRIFTEDKFEESRKERFHSWPSLAAVITNAVGSPSPSREGLNSCRPSAVSESSSENLLTSLNRGILLKMSDDVIMEDKEAEKAAANGDAEKAAVNGAAVKAAYGDAERLLRMDPRFVNAMEDKEAEKAAANGNVPSTNGYSIHSKKNDRNSDASSFECESSELVGGEGQVRETMQKMDIKLKHSSE